MLTIRPAVLTDLDGITEIYNNAILETVATFDTEPKTRREQEAWFAEHGAREPVLVAEEDDIIVGWASLSQWSDRCAYKDTAESSLYVRKECRGRGIGKKLGQAIVDAGKLSGLHTVIARIAEGNEISVHVFESAGFEHVGVMKEVGLKFGRRLDVYMLQKIL